jgi:beta-lactamase class A
VIDRRQFALGAAGVLLLPGCAAARPAKIDAAARLAAIEKAAGGRLGAYIIDTARRRSIGWRARERFAHCSTFKLSLAALVLREADAGRLRLDEVLAYARADLLPNSPDTGAAADKGGMTVAALAEAAQKTSDNTAANLLLRRLGGPQGLTAFWRSLGDRASRLDRYETELNRVPPGELRDTTTPEAMARSVERFLLGNVLAPASRVRLGEWMEATATGARRIRAGVPADWRGGDKTGTANSEGMANKVNDIAVLYPPGGRRPLIITGYYEADAFYPQTRPQDEAVLRQLGELAVEWAR